MKKRHSHKAMSMGQPASFNWQVREDVQPGQAETLVDLSTPRRARMGWIVVVSVLLIGGVGFWGSEYWLPHEEADQVQVVDEAAATILLGSNIVTPNIPALDADIKTEWGKGTTLLELSGEMALVNMVINEPSEPWHEQPFRVARVLQQDGKGWQLVEPSIVFWSTRRTLETKHLALNYSRRDQGAVEEIAADLEAFYLRLHDDLSLAVPQTDARVKIDIALVAGSAVRVTDLSYSGSTLIVPPADLIPRPLAMSNAEALRQAIMYALAVKLFDERQAQFPAPCKWSALTEGIGIWLRWEGHTLPSRRRWIYESVVKEWGKPTLAPRLDDLLAFPLSCSRPPTILETEIFNTGRPIPRQELAATLIEYIVANHGRQAVANLLRDMHQFSDWNTLAEATVQLSAKELEARWQAHLATRTP